MKKNDKRPLCEAANRRQVLQFVGLAPVAALAGGFGSPAATPERVAVSPVTTPVTTVINARIFDGEWVLAADTVIIEGPVITAVGQALVPEAGVEALDKPVLLRLARRDVMPLDVALLRPAQDRAQAQRVVERQRTPRLDKPRDYPIRKASQRASGYSCQHTSQGPSDQNTLSPSYKPLGGRPVCKEAKESSEEN